jgi:hypothetical protein
MLKRHRIDNSFPEWTGSAKVDSKDDTLAQLTALRWQVANLGLREVGQLLAVAELALRDNISAGA